MDLHQGAVCLWDLIAWGEPVDEVDPPEPAVLEGWKKHWRLMNPGASHSFDATLLRAFAAVAQGSAASVEVWLRLTLGRAEKPLFRARVAMVANPAGSAGECSPLLRLEAFAEPGQESRAKAMFRALDIAEGTIVACGRAYGATRDLEPARDAVREVRRLCQEP